MSGYINIEHQLKIPSSKTIRAKENNEHMCLDHGIMVDIYLDYNGVFKSNIFVHNIHEHNQRILYCGINVHN